MLGCVIELPEDLFATKLRIQLHAQHCAAFQQRLWVPGHYSFSRPSRHNGPRAGGSGWRRRDRRPSERCRHEQPSGGGVDGIRRGSARRAGSGRRARPPSCVATPCCTTSRWPLSPLPLFKSVGCLFQSFPSEVVIRSIRPLGAHGTERSAWSARHVYCPPNRDNLLLTRPLFESTCS